MLWYICVIYTLLILVDKLLFSLKQKNCMYHLQIKTAEELTVMLNFMCSLEKYSLVVLLSPKLLKSTNKTPMQISVFILYNILKQNNLLR